MARRSQPHAPELTDAEVRTILLQSMAAVDYDPAVIYAFRTTGVYFYPNCRSRISKEKRAQWERAVQEYLLAMDRPPQ